MSVLDYINDYGSSSDESDGEHTKPKKLKLQAPNLNAFLVPKVDVYIDNTEDHQGRVRSFPHVRGNWPSFVYLKYPKEETLLKLIDKIENFLGKVNNCCHKCDDLHISLSRTVVLQYHLITSFTKSLQECFSNIRCFILAFSSINIYCNEENTRTFISLKVDYQAAKNLLSITNRIDQVLKEYRLPLFYDKPSFHMSLLWLNGNKKSELLPYLEQFNTFLAEEIGNSLDSVIVKLLNCKVGNKYYQFSLE